MSLFLSREDVLLESLLTDFILGCIGQTQGPWSPLMQERPDGGKQDEEVGNGCWKGISSDHYDEKQHRSALPLVFWVE